jgi:hypothetical protein
MVGDLERRVNELRYLDGVEKVEHVPYRTGDEFWVRFNRPLDLKKLEEIARKYNYQMIRFASLPSKLPRGLAEILWDGVAYIIGRKISPLAKLTSSLGFEPEGIAKIAYDLHGPYQIFMATDEEGVKVLYDYVGLKYVAPAPPPKPVAAAKAPTPGVVRPAPPTATPAPTPARPPAAPQPSQSTPVSRPQPSQTAAQPKTDQLSQKQENRDVPAQSTA